MSVMGPAILGSPGPYVYPKVLSLEYAGNTYVIPRLRFGDIHTTRSRALVHQDVPFAASEWPTESEFKMTFLIRCQEFRGLLVSALNRVYLWEEFFRAYIGRPMKLINPITITQSWGVITDMGYSEIDDQHVNMELTFNIFTESDLP